MTPVLRTNGLLLAGAGLSAAITPDLRARVLNDSLVGFLAFLVLLLALSLITIIRIKPPPPQRGPAADEPVQAPVPMPAFRSPGYPAPEPRQRRVPPGPLPVRPVAQRPVGQQPGYAARHAPREVPGQDAVPGQGAAPGQGAVPGQGTAARPRVSGAPPWGPAPRPPDLDPFARSSDWRSSDSRSSDR